MEHALPFKDVITNRMAVIGPLVTGKKVLDLGVVDSRRQKFGTKDRLEKKTNLLFKDIHALNPDVLGLDIDGEGVKILAESGFNVVEGDATSADLNRQFDTIVAGEIIEHLENPGMFLRNMARHLAPNGVMVITTPNPFYAKQTWKIWRYNEPQVHEEHTCWFDPVTLSRLCDMCGLTVREIHWVREKSLGLKNWKAAFRTYFSENFLMVCQRKPG
jgi:SAM-dependent methyltransferase